MQDLEDELNHLFQTYKEELEDVARARQELADREKEIHNKMMVQLLHIKSAPVTFSDGLRLWWNSTRVSA